jgi:hypothetical protein
MYLGLKNICKLSFRDAKCTVISYGDTHNGHNTTLSLLNVKISLLFLLLLRAYLLQLGFHPVAADLH